MASLVMFFYKFLVGSIREASKYVGTSGKTATISKRVIQSEWLVRQRSKGWISLIIYLILHLKDGAEALCINRKSDMFKTSQRCRWEQNFHPLSSKRLIKSKLMDFIENDGATEKIEDSVEVNTNGVENATDMLFHDEPANGAKNGETAPPPKISVRSIWRRRHARSSQEGIRREITSPDRLSSLLRKAQQESFFANRQLVARTMTGFINAVAEKAEDLSVEVTSRKDTPFWEKQIDSIEINFSRLEFRPIRLGGMSDKKDLNRSIDKTIKLGKNAARKMSSSSTMSDNLEMSDINMLEAFERIDADNSGTLDRDEIAEALDLVTSSSSKSDRKLLTTLASELVDLYDANGDGVVDFEEYQLMVKQMAALQEQQQKQQEEEGKQDGIKWLQKRLPKRRWFNFGNNEDGIEDDDQQVDASNQVYDDIEEKVTKRGSNAPLKSGAGSITFTDLKLDLRRLLFGVVPIVKKVTPGGPLVLEPFVTTLKGSFNNEDIMQSFLVNRGLRLLAARAIRRRVRSFRDILDGAVFYGRSWNMASVRAPVVEVPCFTAVEFDKRGRLIITGLARLRASPEAPEIENAFKLRTRLGSRRNGQTIRLEQPELALVVECPKAWERNIVSACKKFNLTAPSKPDPIYSFFPIYSPFKLEDDDGFDMGPDNRLKSLEIRDGALHFEMQAILRPGRFLGSHYVAFTLPMRTCLITLDRVVDGIRTARRNKREAQAAAKLEAQRLEANGDGLASQNPSTEFNNTDDFTFVEDPETEEKGKEETESKKSQSRPSKSFFSRFIEGYQGVDKEEEVQSERFTMAVSEWFARQGKNNDASGGDDNSTSVDSIS